MAQPKEYYAFISYKREDEKWAKWLQDEYKNYYKWVALYNSFPFCLLQAKKSLTLLPIPYYTNDKKVYRYAYVVFFWAIGKGKN